MTLPANADAVTFHLRSKAQRKHPHKLLDPNFERTNPHDWRAVGSRIIRACPSGSMGFRNPLKPFVSQVATNAKTLEITGLLKFPTYLSF